MLPRVHGSALFTRGETQSLGTVALGTPRDKQRVDGLFGEVSNRFMLHYYFPPYSVGEVRPIRGPGRREIGHGCLAERSVERVIPPEDRFPYTVRVISDITESNGSSSMASVCGGTLARRRSSAACRYRSRLRLEASGRRLSVYLLANGAWVAQIVREPTGRSVDVLGATAAKHARLEQADGHCTLASNLAAQSGTVASTNIPCQIIARLTDVGFPQYDLRRFRFDRCGSLRRVFP